MPTIVEISGPYESENPLVGTMEADYGDVRSLTADAAQERDLRAQLEELRTEIARKDAENSMLRRMVEHMWGRRICWGFE
jgi:hypothetical protein